ncbi:MAG: UDP-N-acetylglucosamine 2-epimerase (non-hydrolyzing) [Sedimenticola sp.]
MQNSRSDWKVATESLYRFLCVVGARPNFMKIAPVMRAMNNGKHDMSVTLLHTGQHYDNSMKQSFFDQLGIPKPDIDLGVGSGSHAVQTAEVMSRFEPVLDQLKPNAVIVVGDVNSTIACALVAVKKDIPVFHIEAGLRSYDRKMPEEINRVLTDQISELLFTTESSARDNLLREGIDGDRIHFVGNVMIDTLRYNLDRAKPLNETLTKNGLVEKASFFEDRYGLVTLHRPSNVDDPVILERLLNVLNEISEQIPLVFPMHPRTRKCIENACLDDLINSSRIQVLPPVGYLEMLGMMKGATVVLTDSGGIQEETTSLGVPCVTLRENTERPITVDQGTNSVVGTDANAIKKTVEGVLSTGGKTGCVPELWDGRAAERIVDTIFHWANNQSSEPAPADVA